MEMWTGKPVDYSNLHIFGSPVYVMYNAQETTKLDPKFRKCLFFGYADGVKGYRLQGMKVLTEKNLLPSLTKVSLPFCEHCITSKQHRLQFNTSNSRSKTVLELVHSDVWQAPVSSLGGAKYFVSFIDDYSRRCWVYPIKSKGDVFTIFKTYKA